MSRDSLGAAKAELLALLAPAGVPAIAGVTCVYGFEPYSGQAQGPVAITISTAGMTPTEYLIVVRVYQTVDVDAEAAQAAMDLLIAAVDTLVGSTGRFGPSSWTVEYDRELNKLVAANILEAGREDGF